MQTDLKRKIRVGAVGTGGRLRWLLKFMLERHGNRCELRAMSDEAPAAAGARDVHAVNTDALRSKLVKTDGLDIRRTQAFPFGEQGGSGYAMGGDEK
jgi:hypothetical protein